MQGLGFRVFEFQGILVLSRCPCTIPGGFGFEVGTYTNSWSPIGHCVFKQLPFLSDQDYPKP